MKIENDEVVLSTGRRLYAYGRIVGIRDDLLVTYGHDGRIVEANDPNEADDEEDRASLMTVAEKIELADFMIALWQRYKEKASQ